MCLFLNSIIISCFFMHLISNSHSYFYDQHIIIILSIISHLGLTNLSLLQNSLLLVFTIRVTSLIIQYLIIILNDKHPYKIDCKYIFLDLTLKNLAFYPQNYGPFFKLGYFKYGYINYNEFDEIAKTHSFQILFFLRAVAYLEMLAFLILNILQQSEKQEQGLIAIKIITYTSFIFYSIITIIYFIQQLKKIINKKFEYLTINYSTPSEILRLINDKNSINFLYIQRVIQENQQIQQRINYQPLENQEVKYQNLIKQLFQFIYQQQHKLIEQRIEIPNLFTLKYNCVYLNSEHFLSHYLNHIRQSKISSKKKIILTNLKRKQFNYQLNQALLDRVFNLGLDSNFFRFGTETTSSQFIMYQYISQLSQLIAFRKYIQPNMVMNPAQLTYDLFE
ncbi:transmembrane protein, putative (macronuclear) [Tetrahymena thermophila SB210]|uniref:Transmembrane protein, putative n=1 Tax=Tetrahymena thermophila (strain SB210) TaxID=312017 RepID=W7XCE7_TETTS|nr:transmembrane protein, putative [Tetrahymena thermophila SB210]EWS75117.1 transmembrane protein, putative [Tetrahymena thermophila SB210]|eukprot:XP_012652355.1 transmembrane protein, putative [Tetrahymena thermophila SB210]